MLPVRLGGGGGDTGATSAIAIAVYDVLQLPEPVTVSFVPALRC